MVWGHITQDSSRRLEEVMERNLSLYRKRFKRNPSPRTLSPVIKDRSETTDLASRNNNVCSFPCAPLPLISSSLWLLFLLASLSIPSRSADGWSEY